jgi:glycosyltransferase involved in cell wall biosynthesis
MKVETYIVTWNREDTIHLTIKHYLELGSVIIYDNWSTDRTREIAESLGAEVRVFGRQGELDDQAYLDVKNHAWKGSKADWVIVVDDDEILYHPNLKEVLSTTTGTIFKTQGFNIHSDDLPRETWLDIQTGEPNENYSKLCIFNPKQITEIKYNFGCHVARPMGNIVWADTRLTLLHYRNVGGVERLIARHKLYKERLSEVNRKYNLGHHYTESEQSKRTQWKEFTERSVTLSEAGLL